MSHEENIVCPNCGHPTTLNYCAQCGQETHLHKDTLWGLFTHFIGHFFHYDSKLWKTIRALLFSPGKLTTAYKNKQRARYIAPVSLYIFISAIYFISLSLFFKVREGELAEKNFFAQDTVSVKKITDPVEVDRKDINDRVRKILDKKGAKHQEHTITDFEKDSPIKNLEGLFVFLERTLFFMIPVMAIVLQLLFLRNRQYSFVDHTIFSLHYQSFFFCILFALLLDPFSFFSNNVVDTIDTIFVFGVFAASIVYMVKALKNHYGISTGRSIWYSILIGISYAVIFLIVFVGYFAGLYAVNMRMHHGG